MSGPNDAPWRRDEIARNADDGLRIAKQAESNCQTLSTRVARHEHRISTLETELHDLTTRVGYLADAVHELTQRLAAENT